MKTLLLTSCAAIAAVLLAAPTSGFAAGSGGNRTSESGSSTPAARARAAATEARESARNARDRKVKSARASAHARESNGANPGGPSASAKAPAPRAVVVSGSPAPQNEPPAIEVGLPPLADVSELVRPVDLPTDDLPPSTLENAPKGPAPVGTR